MVGMDSGALTTAIVKLLLTLEPGDDLLGTGPEGDEPPERTKFSSEAEAKKFQNTAGIKWWCKRSKQSHYHKGKPCRMCNP